MHILDMINKASDQIEILPVSLLDAQRQLVEEMQQISEAMSIGLGWHYLLDLSWAAHHLGPRAGMRVMDAGAGTGIMQWWLADQGVDVISADRQSRAHLSTGIRRRYRIKGLRHSDLDPLLLTFRDFLPSRSPRHWLQYPHKLAGSLRLWLEKTEPAAGKGTIVIYNQDLQSIPDIADNSVDAIVSISALEHNSPEGLRDCLTELIRVLKPGGKLVATLVAAKDQDWFHEPSKGWCYTEATLRDIFNLPNNCPSNYDRYDELFETLQDCRELRDRLADFYFQSGSNGMPWGIWDLRYQPVGVVKVKFSE
jgi:ubiquinone/menaquinone biosynthesis C-methylase UbiE